MKKSIIALMIAGIVGLTGCSSDNKTEDLKNNLQPEGSVQVDSANLVETQNQVEPEVKKEKWVYLTQAKELGVIVYYDANHIENVVMEENKQNHKKVLLKGLSTIKNNKNKELYMDIELDCSGKAKTIEMRMFENGNLIWTKNKKNAKGYDEWEVIDPNAIGPEAMTEKMLCKQE